MSTTEILAAPTAELARELWQQTEHEFRALADHWWRETVYLSNSSRRQTHPPFLKIIGMGRPAVPLILREMQTERSAREWCYALQVITGESPGGGRMTYPEKKAAWLGWGREKGLL